MKLDLYLLVNPPTIAALCPISRALLDLSTAVIKLTEPSYKTMENMSPWTRKIESDARSDKKVQLDNMCRRYITMF